MKITKKLREPQGGIRHGEVALIPTTDKLRKAKKFKKYIVAHSETGHHHVLESDRQFKVDEQEMLIEFLEDAVIVHKKSFDEHKTLQLKKNTYKRFEAIEYDPFAEVTRRVID